MSKRSFVYTRQYYFFSTKSQLSWCWWPGQLILCLKGTCTLFVWKFKMFSGDCTRGRVNFAGFIQTNEIKQDAGVFFVWIVFMDLSVLYDYEDWSPDLSNKRKVTRSVMWLLLKTSHLCVCVAKIGAQFNPWELPTLLSLSLGDDGRLPPLPPLSSPPPVLVARSQGTPEPELLL